MRCSRKLALYAFIIALTFSVNIVYALPSGGVYPPEFHYKDGYWYDSWNINRNYYADEDGYLPNIAYESLGSNKDLAYGIGEWFEESYDNRVERAEVILNYVQKYMNNLNKLLYLCQKKSFFFSLI